MLTTISGLFRPMYVAVFATVSVAFVILAPGLSAGLAFAGQAIDWSSPVKARCVRALDGDSLLARVDRTTIEIRLVGIDAPEYGQEWGEEAKGALQKMCRDGLALRLERDRNLKDRYGRYLLWVWSGDTLINERMVENGLALPYIFPPNQLHAMRVNFALNEARNAAAGFWEEGGLRMTPRQWRKSHPRHDQSGHEKK